MTSFTRVAEVLDAVTATTKRKEKIRYIAEFLSSIEPSEVSYAALLIAGRIFAESDQRSLNVSWSGIISSLQQVIDIKPSDVNRIYDGDIGEAVASLMESGQYARQSSLFEEHLTILSVKSAIERIASLSGKGSKSEREAVLANLLRNASPRESRYLVAILLGDTRTGVSDAMLIEAIAEAYSIESVLVRRAWSFCGDLGGVAETAKMSGERGVRSINIQLFTPIRPMLATPAQKIDDVFTTSSPTYCIEYKYDGARVQIHKKGKVAKIYSRRMTDVTESMPEIVNFISSGLKAESVILDGEVVAIGANGRPLPFQEVMKRFGRSRDVGAKINETELQLYLFDIIFLNGTPLSDLSLKERRRKLVSVAPPKVLAPSFVAREEVEAQKLFDESKELGHEGIMVKNPESSYTPGTRGKNWFKIKHTLQTLDMVVLAAEWGHGRRKNWLSDYHLGVIDEATGEYVMVGKTFKGLTDAELETMTARLQKLEVSSSRGVVSVRPEIVVEVLASELQKSPTYESGIALRFARIVRIREDRGPSDITSLNELEQLYESQFRYKSK
jgi:DNA ligase-1